MSRLIFVPQYPSSLRYSEWWLPEFTKEFKKEYDEVVVLGFDWLWKNNHNGKYDKEMFSPINQAIRLETEQMNEYMSLDIRDNDTLFLADISFPGLFCNVLYHRPCPKMYAFCHATSLNAYDYFQPMRKYKKKIELEHAKLFDGIFFGSSYSANKTNWSRKGIKCHVVALPESPKGLITKVYTEKNIDIISVCRPSIQKVNKRVEKKVERVLGIKIYREEIDTWSAYSDLLSRSKVLLITAKEDTFNYTILDAIRCGCIPIAPNSMCFPEILPPRLRYDNSDDLILKLRDILWEGEAKIPEILCQDKIDNFFENITKTMKE